VEERVARLNENLVGGQLIEIRTQPVFVDIAWAPDSARRCLSKLGNESPSELGWLNEKFSAQDAGDVAREISQDQPSVAANGSAQLWICVARFAEGAGAWDAAADAWLEAATRADGADRISGLVSSAIAAHVGGDDDRYARLIDEAAAADPNHPRLRLERAGNASAWAYSTVKGRTSTRREKRPKTRSALGNGSSNKVAGRRVRACSCSRLTPFALPVTSTDRVHY
jgi:hypothetical protein